MRSLPLPHILSPLLLTLALTPTLPAENLGGGIPAATGEFPRLTLDRWIPGQPGNFRFTDLPPNNLATLMILGTRGTTLVVGAPGVLTVDPLSPAFTILPIPSSGFSLNPIPKGLEGLDLFFQGIYWQPQTGLALTDGTRATLASPLAMVGNSRQSANSLTVIDVASANVLQNVTNSENGYIEFSPDRTRAYVCEPGLQRNRVVVYDLTKTPVATLTTVSVSGGIRYGGSMPADGTRLYVPVHDGVVEIDTDPKSSTYHTVLRKFPTSITGASASIFTGPMHTAVTPNGHKLYVACGENQANWPSQGTVFMFDLRVPNPVEKQIPVTNGGILSAFSINLATRPYIEMSPLGDVVYVLESGTNISGFFLGFVNGSLINVIDTRIDREVTTMATGGFYQEQIGIDRMGRGLFAAQVDKNGNGELVHFDVDIRSKTRHTVLGRYPVGVGSFSVGSGPTGVDVTADGALAYVSIVENGSNPAEVWQFDVLNKTFLNKRIPAQSLCHTVSIQK